MQPRVRALPLELRAARSTRAHDRRVHGDDRRARADAGLLREHRRRRADRARGLLGAARLRHGHHVGVKFSTNGSRITAERGAQLAASDYVDVQISLDGATAAVNDAVRGAGSYATAIRAMEHLAGSGFKLSVVVTRENASQLDQFKALADFYGAQLRLTRLRPSGRGADVWDQLHPTQAQQREVYEWLLAHGEEVLTGDSFFHLAAFGQSLPGLNLCGAGRVVCLIDPVGDVYACPFAIHDTFLAGNVRTAGFAPCGGSPRCSASCASRSRRARAPRAGCSTPAAAAAWRRSSSPGCRSPDRTRNACSGTASPLRPPAEAVEGSLRSGAGCRSRSSPADGLVRVGRRGAAARAPGAAGLGLQGADRGLRARLDAARQRRGVRRAGLRAARRRARRPSARRARG